MVTAGPRPATAVRAGILFPHATQAIQVVRRRWTRTGRWRTETAYAVTPLAAEQAAELADAVRGHWHVENRLHWVCHVTFTEDHRQVRTGNAPVSWRPYATSRSPSSGWPA